MSLMRLAYASEATFAAKPAEKGVEPNVARILMVSRRNNAKSEIVGGLYYGDDHFFQYLEGEEEAVRELYDRIARDDRHHNISILLEEPIKNRTFTNWSMKYVPLSSDVNRFLDTEGMEAFVPSEFNRDQCEEMIRLIRDSSDSGRVVSHDGVRNRRNRESVIPGGILAGLIAAGVFLVGAMVYVGTML
ncbi:BLUF domain-containing protein [Marinobacter orientalis]|uniref:BLUF domain-containing protein n=1 Tax=Marinobacter orientalis TaxID=1928859 RepID=A0A7Y0WT46_9GAMM|nr:BLUF domain-containing protein [Marinobacter orientalis]NMT64568.1 BLUF domain-containing protein [Marinobacter orientalis]TGX50480.1 BLUF domain-containing protein [Marinobacter orientalis]